MRNRLILFLWLCCGVAAAAQTEDTDSIATRELKEVVVEGRNERLGAEVSTYVPTSRQKNAAQTAADLLNRMAIPQLRISPDDQITDPAGKSVDVFIDFLPASSDDMQGMRIQDVKRVEYYDFPTDPRFQGKAHVVNFVMQKYEYGGYVKAFGWENTSNAGQLSIYSKLQYKRMTFDIAAGTFYLTQKHTGGDTYETFRLPQSDGTTNVFERNSIQSSGELRKRIYWPTFKALYSTEKIMLQNVVGASFDHTPADDRSGYVVYTPEISSRTDYSQKTSNRVNSLSYNGYWNFILNDNNSISFTSSYDYSFTRSNNTYSESDGAEYYNGAMDHSHQFRGDLIYSHSFGKWGTLNPMMQVMIVSNNTSYSGTASQTDNAHTYRVGPGIQYSVSKGKFYGLAGFGYHWNRQKFLDYHDDSAAPWVDLSLQYSPKDSHSIRAEFHHMRSIPSSSYRSQAMIQSNPLMYYTGNPNLVSYGSYDVGANYTFIPGNKFSLSAFASTWIVTNRYVYDYEPTATHIVRRIIQPGGGYSKWDYGVYATLRLFDRSLQLSAQLNAASVHNGAPYNYNKTHPVYALKATYYWGKWTFSGLFYSTQGYSDGCMVGTWMRTKTYYMLSAGWSNRSWNLNLQLANFGRWNWRSDESEMRSRYYDKIERTYSINDHALARLSVTYTFGYGKKVEHGDEATQQSAIDSGILK